MASLTTSIKKRRILEDTQAEGALIVLYSVAAATDLPDPDQDETVTLGVLENGDLALKLRASGGAITTGTLAVIYA